MNDPKRTGGFRPYDGRTSPVEVAPLAVGNAARVRALLAIAIILPMLMAAAIQAEDWPQWRGANRDGVWTETGLLEIFPADGLRVRWRVPVSAGWSSPVVAKGRVYVMDSQLERPKARERVICFEETSGKLLWKFTYDVGYPEWAFIEDQGYGPVATPIVQDGQIFALGANGHVTCLDANNGSPLWEKSLDQQHQISVLECRASPLIEGDLLILFIARKSGPRLIALDKTTGKEVWSALEERATNCSPLVITAGGKRQLIVWTTDSVTSLDPITGKTYWRERLVTIVDNAVSTPICLGDLLLIGGLMLKLDADKPGASVLWPETKAASRRILSNTSTALFRGDLVFSAKSSGELVCLEASTGKQVWETAKVTDLKNGASIHLTSNGSCVFLYTDKGELIRAQLTAKGYEEISRSRLLEPTYPFSGRKVAWSPPAFANRHVFARTEKELICAFLSADP